MLANWLKPRSKIVHPLIASIYPILALSAYNIDQNPLSVALRPLALSILASLAIWGASVWLLKSTSKGAIFATLAISIFFAYGRIYSYASPLVPHKTMVLVGLLILGLAFVYLNLQKKDFDGFNRFLNIFALILLIFPVFQLGAYYFDLVTKPAQIRQIQMEGETLEASLDSPDIYYIILDMYTREDFLLEKMGYDNSEFLTLLENDGFFIADCSLSNYSTTKFSLSSSLNMDYLENLMGDIDPTSTSEGLVDPLLIKNRVRQILESYGYSIVSFQTDYHGLEWRDADHFFELDFSQTELDPGQFDPESSLPKTDRLTEAVFGWNLNKFEWLLLQTTAAIVLVDRSPADKKEFNPGEDYLSDIRQYLLVKQTLENADLATKIEGPKFVYVHVVSPHPPFVFKSDGSFTTKAVEREGNWYDLYTNQLQYINSRIYSLVETIFASSTKPPIIIIQGDHGIPMRDANPLYQHNEILNAYYLPGAGDALLNEHISPVNTFRMVLNHYFNMEFDYLEDEAFTYNWLESPYVFEPYEEQSDACK